MKFLGQQIEKTIGQVNEKLKSKESQLIEFERK
jgi:hypothetical protein